MKKRLYLFENDELKFECLKKEYHLLEAKLAEGTQAYT